MIKIGNVKASARNSLENKLFGHLWVMVVVCAVIGGIVVAVPGLLGSILSSAAPVIGALIGVPLMLCTVLIKGPVTYSLARIYHRISKGDKDVKIPDLVVGFKECFSESVLLSFMSSLFIALWSLLLIIPGIVKSYAYSMAFFIQQDAKGEKNWRVCLDESTALTNGYKWKLFLLDLSFIGWYILGYLCLGIGILWVSAYHQEAKAHFYEELKREKYGVSEEDFEKYGLIDADFEDDDDDEEVFDYSAPKGAKDVPLREDKGKDASSGEKKDVPLRDTPLKKNDD